MDVIEKSIDHTLPSNLSDDSLQEWLICFGLVFYKINAFPNLWDLKKMQSGENLIPSSESPPKIELKPSPDSLKYTILGEEIHC